MSAQNYHRKPNTHEPSSTDSPEVHCRKRCDRLRVLRSLLGTKYKERDSSIVESVIVKKLLGSSVNFTGDQLAQKLAKCPSSIFKILQTFFFTIPHHDLDTLG